MSQNGTSSTGCPVHDVLPHDPVPFFSNGDLNFKAHDVGWLLCGTLAITATVTSCWLIKKHLSFYYHPTEQRHIVRLLLMPVIYAICSFLSYMLYKQALYFKLLRDCYEALVIAAFFFLLLSYLSNPPPTPDNPIPRPYATKAERDARLREVVKDLHLRKWMWPMGWLKWRPAGGGPGEGEAFLWWMRVCIGQYVIVRPLSTLASVIGEASGYYCLASWSPKFVHVWSSAAITVSVTVAMYCVLQLYMPLREPLKPYQPVLKFLCVKLVVFFTFWQETSLSFLVTLDVIKSREYWTAEEIVIGLSALLSCVEMVVLAFLHVKAFSYLPYRALASPVSLSADGAPLLPSCSVDSADFDPEKAHSFASWSAWNARVAARDASLARLAKPKLPAGFDPATGAPPRKADGLPLLQQTRKWPALRAALDFRDLFGEIGEETRFVLRGGRVDEMALLEARRGDDLEKAFGARRPAFAKLHSGFSEDGEERETELERDLRRLREGRLVTSGRAKVALDGSLVRPAHRQDPARVHPATSSTSPAVWQYDAVEEPAPSPSGWWGSLRAFGTRGRRPPLAEPNGTFEQLPRVDYTVVPVQDVPAVVGADWRIPVLPPHRLGTPHGGPLRPRSTLDPPSLVAPGPTLAHKEPSGASSAAASQDSYSHLPRTTLRPASYVPPHRATPVPSPPPFSHFWRQSQPSPAPPPAQDDRFTAFAPPSFAQDSSPSHAYSHSVPVVVLQPSAPAMTMGLAPPPAALLMASPESRRSQGLPPGAMPPRG